MRCRTCLTIVVVLIAVLLAAFRVYNERGPQLWFGPVPTAKLDLPHMRGKVVIITGANTGPFRASACVIHLSHTRSLSFVSLQVWAKKMPLASARRERTS